MSAKLPDSCDTPWLTHLAADLGIKTTAGVTALRLMLENAVLFEAQVHDTDFGVFGAIARMNTEFLVLKNHFNKKRRRVVTDAIRLTLRNIANEAVCALLIENHEPKN